nr:DUF2268 domain-containing putative Zn-dependent protease [Sulfobacillus harzensis]
MEPLATQVLDAVIRQYPVSAPLSVEIYPMDPDDLFGVEKLAGVSGWTNWEGNIIHLVAFAGWRTWPALCSTVVHEYHHYWRTAACQNGHSRITLLEKIIREGLAEHFVADVLGSAFQGPWVSALTAREACDLWWSLYRSHVDDVGMPPMVMFLGAVSLGFRSGLATAWATIWSRGIGASTPRVRFSN